MTGIPVILSSIQDNGIRNYALIVVMSPESLNKTIQECHKEIWRTHPYTGIKVRIVTCIVKDSFPPISLN